MGFLHPELLILLVPAVWVWWSRRGEDRTTRALRLAAVLAVVLALAAPYLRTVASGRDLVVVVDRSRSMPPDAESAALELVALAEEARAQGDRVAVVGFGGRAAVERLPADGERFAGFARSVDADGSDLAAALETALNLIPEGRRGGILLVSDGESNGADPVPVARRAFSRDVRIDVRPFARPGTADLAVERIELPQEVAAGEPFQFTVWVRSDRRVETEFVMERGATRLSSGTRTFQPGLNRLVFRDVVDRAGVADYTARVAPAGGTDGLVDRVPENNRGIGAVLVQGQRAVLVVNHDGAEDTLVRALRKARIPVAVASPEGAPLDRLSLTGFRAVILENVAANRLGEGLHALRELVTDRGGGLLVTGGKASFGVGGYFLSPLDDVLPVSMEMRQEHRKQGVAMAIVMDRSGSMTATVPDGRSKMDLANLGAVAAMELLSPIDAISVIAVDSKPHVVQSLAPVTNIGPIASRVRRIEAGGGGIYVYTGLVVAVKQLEHAPQKNKHIILFADAADAEEQERVPALLKAAKTHGITLSVIALGSETDSDAAFLKTTAAQGEGEAYFTQSATELPRLFAQDTLTAARSTFVEEPTAASVLPDLLGLGEIPSGRFPTIEGYNLTYLRAGANAGVVTNDEYRAPLFAFQYQGIGRSAAFTGEIGGAFGQSLVQWQDFATFFVTVVRWLAGQEEPTDLFPSVRREGSQAVISVEVEAGSGVPPDTAHLAASLTDANGARTDLVLERVTENRFEARHPLAAEGITLGTVRLGEDRFVTLPPIALPYSPEFERSTDPERGERLLRRVASESGGAVATTVPALFEGERESSAWRVVSRELLVAAILLLLFEIAGRRLQLWGSLGVPAGARTAAARAGAAAGGLARRLRPRRAAEHEAPKRRESAPATPDESAPAESAPAAGASRSAAGPQEPSPGAEPPSLGSALERARREAGRKLGR